MKRLLTSAALFLCSLLTFAQYSGSGSGTIDDPYLIFNETQLSQMANFLNQDGVVFRLMKDLDLTDWIDQNSPSQGWQPIGVETSPFKGKLIGNNKTISGVFIKRQSASYVGFFGNMDGATVSDLTIKGSSIKGNQYVGIFTGKASNTTLTNINVEMTGSVTGETCVGGLAGQVTESTMTNLTANVTGGVSGSSQVGGLIGDIYSSSITTFSVAANVSGSQIIGGAFGSVNDGTFTSGTITGNVSATDGKVGGVIATANGCSLENIVMKGNATANGATGHVAGILAVGENGELTLTNCTYVGDIEGQTVASGCIGALESGASASFTSCSSKGKIINEGDYTGGIVAVSHGCNITGMESCSHFGDISGVNYVGGVIGAIEGDAANDPRGYAELWSERISENGTYVPSGHLIGKCTDEIIEAGSTINVINNCTAIGNINGLNNIGGVVGLCVPGIGYSRLMDGSRPQKFYNRYNESGYCFFHGGYYGYYNYSQGSGTDSYLYNFKYNRHSTKYTLSNNYYAGNISGSEKIGGIAGELKGGEIKDNYAYGNIYGSSHIGGIIGIIEPANTDWDVSSTTLKGNVTICHITSATNSDVGRIYGSVEDEGALTVGANGSAEGNRALTQTNVILQGVVQEVEDNPQNGSSIGPSLLKLKATYVSMGWDMDNDWNILETECYPYKKYQAAPPVIESNLVSQATSISGKSVDGGTVYLFYKDRNAVFTECVGNEWSFSTEPLQSGAQVQIYADVEGLTPSYFTTANVGYPGSGTEDDPYQIFTAEDLQGASNRGYYKVMNDIDLTSWINENSPEKGWTPIGRNSGDATYIDGAGHTISGLWTNTVEDYTGLFSNFSAGQIKNLNVTVANGKAVKGGNYTGILIGRMANGEIKNCQVSGDVEGTQYVGGQAGYAESTTLTSLWADGKVTTNAPDAQAGGLVGLSTNGTITRCMTDEVVTATGDNSQAGGLVGHVKGDIQLSLSKGSVSATGSNCQTGGLVGYADASTIANSYSTATVHGTDFSAGLVGYAYDTSIDKCYAKGDVSGVLYGAGVVGELEAANARLTNSVAANNILSLTAQSSWGSRVIGGYKSGAPDPDESNYALATMQVSLNNVPQRKTDDLVEGIAKSEEDLMKATTYQALGWDFSSVWGIDEGLIYPYLLWEVDVNPVADITLDKTSLLIAVGKTETINASIMPLGATNKRLDWSTSNANIATVEDGVVTAVGVGSAIITAAATDGSGVTATCRVTVTENKDAAIAELQALVDRAQALYDNSTEGENIGEYAPGARAALLAVINSVKAKISSTMDDSTINECTTQLNNAITQFESQRVTAGEDTDYSQIDNTLYIERVEAAAGGQVQLSVRMKNTIEAQGYQFDLYLPEGVTVATDEDGFVLAELSTARTTERKTDYFNCSVQADGSLRVLCGSSKGYAFSGNDGEVAVITINLSPDMDEGEYPIILKNVRISDKNSVPYVTDYLKSTLAISSYTLGDVNADGSVDVADFIAVANHILGNTPEVFVHKAADVNVDNSIDVADFIGIANMILNGTAGAANQGQMMMAPRRADSMTPTDIDALDNAIYVEPITAAPGTRQVLSLRMKNTGDVAGFELNLQLPDGITIATDEDDMLMVELSTERTNSRKTDYFNSAIQDDGTLKILCGSSTANPQTGKVYTFSGNEGEVARITVDIPVDYEAGEYDVHVLNAIMADADSHKKELEPDIISLLTIEENDGRIHFAETDTSLPAYTAGEKGDITMARTINAGEWSTIVLPFNLTRANATKAFGEDVQFATFSGFEVDYGDDEENVTPLAITLKFDSYTIPARGNLAGGTPVLIKTGKNISEIKLDGVTLVSTVTNVETADADYGFPGKFIGTLVKTTVPEDGLFLSGNKFWYSTGKTNIKAFRGWFELGAVLNKESDFGANLNFVIDGDPTSIDGIPGYMIRKGDVYTIQGQYVGHDVDMKRLPSGIYIVDGKKMVIK
ncbi:MAG: Ig-like domain-containing protein [Prevotella sp.]|nr:Ig-like domain-containing protein [Prevotella sp.]